MSWRPVRGHVVLGLVAAALGAGCVAAASRAAASGDDDPPATAARVSTPPASLGLAPFYKKYVQADGLPIVGSENVPDAALLAAADLVGHLLARRPDVRDALVAAHVRVAVMAKTEVTTDIPEHSDLEPKDYWSRRARGLGATGERPACSCAEENVLGYPDDRYRGESILIHEFAHTIHEMALVRIDPEFDRGLQDLFERAKGKGLWEKTYARTNDKEYWAEGVQSWFDANLQADPPDGIHNHVNTREELEQYDPDLATLIAGVFRNDPWRWRPRR